MLSINIFYNTFKHVLSLFKNKKKSSKRNILLQSFYTNEVNFFYKNNIKIIELSLKNIRNNKAYTVKTINKKNGKLRYLSIPETYTKNVQTKMNLFLHKFYHIQPSAHAFIKSENNKKNIVTNASFHVNKEIVINVDIENFFDSINFGRVRGMFLSYPYNLDTSMATKLAQLTVYKNKLPQGAPTSPIISNMICYKLDKELMFLAKDFRCMYTRYADDITFSTNDKKLKQKELLKKIKQTISSNGFNLNSSKTRIQDKYNSQIVTGLKVNKKVNLKKTYIRQIRSMLYSLYKDGLTQASNKHFENYNVDKKYTNDSEKSFIKILRGKIEFIGLVLGKNSYIYKKNLYLFYLLVNGVIPKKYYNEFEKVNLEDNTFLKLSLSEIYDSTVIFTEGETDITYLKAALKFFRKKNMFLDLKIRFISLGGYNEVKKFHQAIFLTTNDAQNIEFRKSLLPFLSPKINYFFIADSDVNIENKDKASNYFNNTDVPNSFYLILEREKQYIEKLFDKETIKSIINLHGFKIEPEKANKQKVTNKLINHLINDYKIDDFFSIDSYIVYNEKQIFKTRLATLIYEDKSIDYSKFEDLFNFINKNRNNNYIPW